MKINLVGNTHGFYLNIMFDYGFYFYISLKIFKTVYRYSSSMGFDSWRVY